ncbi:MAG: hypothetical protein FWH27_18720 [Planctomycetaceae bacterium]|nr:hypothetical protein [Planctomycetaceae bacterium]
MNIQFQTLDAGNGEELIVLQKKVWKRILEELEDIMAYDKAKANPNKEFFSVDEVARKVSQKTKPKSSLSSTQ